MGVNASTVREIGRQTKKATRATMGPVKAISAPNYFFYYLVPLVVTTLAGIAIAFSPAIDVSTMSSVDKQCLNKYEQQCDLKHGSEYIIPDPNDIDENTDEPKTKVNTEWRKCLDELNDCPSIETETPLPLKIFFKIGVPVLIGFF